MNSDGYLQYRVTLAELRKLVDLAWQSALEDESVPDHASISDKLIAKVFPTPSVVKLTQHEALRRLTHRELQIGELLVNGYTTNKKIGARLGISPHTVGTYMTSMLRKLEVKSRTAAAAILAGAE